jgi:hypothetical protein
VIDQAKTLIYNFVARSAPVVANRDWPVPAEARWQDVWLTVTPIWAVLATGRVVFYAIERIRYPVYVPPVFADVIEALLLWPFAAVGCYLTVRAWRNGASKAAMVAVSSTLIFGLLARPSYAIGSWLNVGNPQSREWLEEFTRHSNSLYPWVSNTVEYGVLYLSCIAVTLGCFSFMSLVNERRLSTALQAEVRQVRQRALRSQLNPHFLFNSLNSIVSSSDEKPATQLLVTQLSDLLRRMLWASEQDEHDLFDELTYVEEYLEIEQTRQPSRLDWRMNVEPGCARAAVPSLILMPLVENSVTHGLRGGVRTVAIDINVWCTRTELFIQIGNTCSAAPPPRESNRQGLGLRNVADRLDMVFGRGASFRAQRVDSDRFEAQISLPLREFERGTVWRGSTCV